MRPLHIGAGTVIFQKGDPSTAVYLIEDGEVAITVGEGAGRTEVARLHAGELFGESGVLEARARSATATAMTDVTVLETGAEAFVHAFGMDNDRALSLVKLLCRRLRGTNLRAVQAEHPEGQTATSGAAIQLVPDHPRLSGEFAMTPIDVHHLPFQVGNRFGGETLPIASNHSCCIPARGEPGLSAPHFEILRRSSALGVRDLGSRHGTIVNGKAVGRNSFDQFVVLHPGQNTVIAGRPDSPFRFRILVK